MIRNRLEMFFGLAHRVDVVVKNICEFDSCTWYT